jgi:tetratricopeptide (TPR) repeat protein
MAALPVSVEPRPAAIEPRPGTSDRRSARLRGRGLRPLAILGASLIVVLASRGAANRAAPPPAASTAQGTGAGPALTSPEGPALAAERVDQIDHAIGTWSANLRREARDFYAATNLGLLYEARARLTGDVADYQRSKEALEQALAIVPGQTAAAVLHARIQASLHDFPAALAEARAVLAKDPSQLQALATMGDAALELGDVAGAEDAYEALAERAPGPAVEARLSRLAFIQGRPDDAWQLAGRAFREAKAQGQSGPSLSWYAYVLGSLAITAGEPSSALEWFRRATDLWPGSYLAEAGIARAEAGLGRADDAIRDYVAAVSIAPQPDALAALGDLYALNGDEQRAQQQYDTVEAIAHLAALNAQVFNRQLVLFSVNHDRDVGAALQLAERELSVRRDVYGYDAYAWALLANGRAREADVAIRTALGFGTRDPLLEYHAGLIAAAVGELDRARDLLTAALAPAGALDPLAATRARASLGALR